MAAAFVDAFRQVSGGGYFRFRRTFTWTALRLTSITTTMILRRSCPRQYSTDATEPDRTTVQVMNNDIKDRLLINSFSQVGFRLNIGLFVIGSIALFPQSVLAWGVSSANEINEASMSLLHVLEPKVDIVVIGVGDRGNRIEPGVIQSLSRRRIYVETLPTDRACSTYNFLAAEDRHVVALLVPPLSIRKTEADAFDRRISDKKLFKLDLFDNDS